MAGFVGGARLVSVLALAAALAQPLAAQTAKAPDEGKASPAASPSPAITDTSDGNTIIVTGTHIPRAAVVSIAPVAVLGARQIDAALYTNLGQALSELPQFGVPANSAIGTSNSPFAAGQTFIDLYSLGSQRTLTLVDGRRFVSSNAPETMGPAAGSQVDFNLIPETLVDRVEVLSVGGAPVYGSDAIAGTVNIILKRNFSGFRISAENGISQRGDAGEHRLSATVGRNFAGGRGNITLSGEWTKGNGLTTADRPLTSSDGPFYGVPTDPAAPFAQQLYHGERINQLSPYGIPMFYDAIPQYTGIRNDQGALLAFNGAGRLVPFDLGTPTGVPIVSSGGDGFRIGDYGTLLASTERYLGTALAHYDVSDAVRFFGEGWYAHSRATNLRNQPYYSSALFGTPAGTPTGNLLVSLNNPFLNPADAKTIADYATGMFGFTPDSFYLTRANTDLESGSYTSTVEMYRLVGGVDGDVSIAGKPWHYEASLTYGHSRTSDSSRQVVFQNLQNAINATTDANGNIVCAPGYVNAPIATISATCSPIDLFGQSNTAMQRAAIDYVTALARSTSVNTQFVADLNLRGTVLRIPGGDVQVALGYEHRRESASFDPGAYFYGATREDGSRAGFGNAIPVDPIAGAFHTDEAFVELRVPVVSPDMHIPVLSRLELDGAARYVRNSLNGGAWTYTMGGIAAPISDISFRGNYTRSIRSPAVAEVFDATSSSLMGGADPCDMRFIGDGPNPARRQANCQAAGVPADFISNYSTVSIPGSISGNRHLRNERADSYTFGGVITPRALPGLSLSADYVNIAIKDEIVLLSGDDLLAACYDAASYPNSFCADAPRDSSGQISFIKTGYYNASVARLKAVTAQFAYAFDLGRIGLGGDAGSLGLSVNYYHVIDQYQRVGADDIDHSAGEIGNPKDSFTANLNYSGKNLKVLWQTQYFGPSKIDADAAPSTYQYPALKDWYLFNASIGYTIDRRFDLTFVVDNVFGKKPPYSVPAAGGTITYFSGLLGRYFKMSVGVKF